MGYFVSASKGSCKLSASSPSHPPLSLSCKTAANRLKIRTHHPAASQLPLIALAKQSTLTSSVLNTQKPYCKFKKRKKQHFLKAVLDTCVPPKWPHPHGCSKMAAPTTWWQRWPVWGLACVMGAELPGQASAALPSDY